MQMNQAISAGIVGAAKQQTVTDQLRDTRCSLENLSGRMDDLINRTGVNVVNEISPGKVSQENPQCADTRSVAHDLQTLCSKLHDKMEILERIA
jgi:hypothetical protein